MRHHNPRGQWQLHRLRYELHADGAEFLVAHVWNGKETRKREATHFDAFKVLGKHPYDIAMWVLEDPEKVVNPDES